MGGDDKPARDVIVVTNFGTLSFTLYKLGTADVAPCGIFIFLLLAGTKALHCSCRSENRHNLSLIHVKQVKKLGKSILSDFYHSLLVKVIKTRRENGRSGANFVLLGVGGLFNLATGRLKNGLKVFINDEWGLSTLLVLVKFDIRVFRAWLMK